MQLSIDNDKGSGKRVYTIIVTDADHACREILRDDREIMAQCAQDGRTSQMLWGLALLARRGEQAAERAGKAPPSASPAKGPAAAAKTPALL